MPRNADFTRVESFFAGADHYARVLSNGEPAKDAFDVAEHGFRVWTKVEDTRFLRALPEPSVTTLAGGSLQFGDDSVEVEVLKLCFAQHILSYVAFLVMWRSAAIVSGRACFACLCTT